MNFEDQVRLSYQLMEKRCKSLNELPKNSKFKICLHTTDASFLKICNDSQYQDFLWLKDLKDKTNDTQLIPISTTQDFGLDFFIEAKMVIKNIVEN